MLRNGGTKAPPYGFRVARLGKGEINLIVHPHPPLTRTPKARALASGNPAAVPLPLPWGRLWFNRGVSLSVAVEVFSRLQIHVKSRLALAFPKAGEGVTK